MVNTKKALLIGICYKETANELNGCINDIVDIKNLLIDKFGYKDQNITLLSDDTPIIPTQANILKSMIELVNDAQPGDQLCLYYSGHGTQIKDKDGDEKKGLDDAIYTLDGKIIIDDDILNIFKNLNGSHITMFFDCCHSGTMCDLPYNLRYNNSKFELWTEKSHKINGSVSLFSGCLDPQTSSDSAFQRSFNDYINNGAFTYMLLEILRENNHITNRNFLMKIYDKLQENNFEQIPQFSCSKMKLLDSIFLM